MSKTMHSAALLSHDLKEDLGPIDIPRPEFDREALDKARVLLREIGRDRAILRIAVDGRTSDREITL